LSFGTGWFPLTFTISALRHGPLPLTLSPLPRTFLPVTTAPRYTPPLAPRKVAELASVAIEDEMAYTLSKISENFSNYSAFHYRSKLIERGAATRTGVNTGAGAVVLLRAELEMVTQVRRWPCLQTYLVPLQVKEWDFFSLAATAPCGAPPYSRVARGPVRSTIAWPLTLCLLSCFA